MSKRVVQTKTHNFDQMLLSQARQATHPAAIVPLIRMAKQAGAKNTVRALQRVEKSLVKQVKQAERAEAKLREREAEKAARKARRERAKANARGYVKPAVGSRVGGRGKVDYSKNWVTLTDAEKAARLADQNRGRSCTSGEYGDGTPTGGYSIENP